MPTQYIYGSDGCTIYLHQLDLGMPPYRNNRPEGEAIGRSLMAYWLPNNSGVNLNNIKLVSASVVFTLSRSEYAQTALTNGTRRMPVGAEDRPTLYNYIYNRETIQYATTGAPGSQLVFRISNLATLKRIIDYGVVLESVSEVLAGNIYGFNRTNQPYIVYSYEDSNTPPVVKATYPTNVVIDGDTENTFTWTYSQSVNRPQSHIDLQYFYENEWFWIADKVAWSRQNYIVTPQTLPSGTEKWRVRVYSNNGATVSNWSELPVVVKAAPPTPNISVSTNTPRPYFEWQAEQQQGYQIKLGNYETGTIYGVNRSFSAPEYYPDGEIEFSVRVINPEGMWSDWSSVVVNIQNQPQGSIQLSTNDTYRDSIDLNWIPDGVFETFYILRNNAPIAKTNDKNFEDHLANGKNKYVVRGIHGDYYTDSNISFDTVNVKNAVISLVEPIDWLKLEKRRNGTPGHSYTNTPRVAYEYLEGRTKPLAKVGRQKEKTHTFAFTYKNREEYLRLDAMCGELVVYKDCMGEKVIGILDQLSSENVYVYDFTFGITEIDYQEAIPYD